MGVLNYPFILYPFLLTYPYLLVGWETRRIWEGNWRRECSTGDWESRFNERNAEDDYYYYFLWHCGRWLIFLKLIIFFIFWYEIFLCWRWFETCQGRFTSFLMTAFSWLDARIIYLYITLWGGQSSYTLFKIQLTQFFIIIAYISSPSKGTKKIVWLATTVEIYLERRNKSGPPRFMFSHEVHIPAAMSSDYRGSHFCYLTGTSDPPFEGKAMSSTHRLVVFITYM